MAFDITTAKPVKDKPKFDPTTAKEVNGEVDFSQIDPMKDISLFGVTGEDVVGAGNLAANIGTGIIAKPVAGGIALRDVVQGEGLQGAETVKQVTEDIQTPLSPEGLAVAKNIGEGLKEIAKTPGIDQLVQGAKSLKELFTKIGETTAGTAADPLGSLIGQPTSELGASDVPEAIGGSVLGAVPETALEVAGFKGLSSPGVKAAASASKLKLPKLPSSREVKKLIAASAPSIDQLKGSARAIYSKIDDLGVQVKPQVTDKLFSRINQIVKSEGFNAKIHPKVSGVLDELQKTKGQTLSVSEIDILRKVARGAARSLDPDEARLGNIIISKIDDSLDNLGAKSLIKGGNPEVGKLYRQARGLWGRARRSKLIEESFEKAKNQASGFENGLRNQFRSILNNKKKIKGFKPEEVTAMRRIVRGGPAENMAKHIGKFGFTEGQASTMLLGSAGVAGGAALGGPVGAVIVPAIGQVSKNLAQKMTRNNAVFANDLVKAGDDARQIINSYFRAVPKVERSSRDLTELLLGKNLSKLTKKTKGLTAEENRLIADALFFTNKLSDQQLKQALGLAALTASEKSENE